MYNKKTLTFHHYWGAFVLDPIYIYTHLKIKPVLELDFRAVKFLFFLQQDLNPHHSLSLTSSALDHIHSLKKELQ